MPPSSQLFADAPWHALSRDQCQGRLETTGEGLSDTEVARRQETFGENAPPRRRRPGVVALFLRQFRDPLIYILLIATLVSVAIGAWNNAGFILAVVLVNATLGTVQEGRAERSAETLLPRLGLAVHVVRGGQRRAVDGRELVPGDVVEISAGDRVPADLRLTQARALRADESHLTGESTPVEKDAEITLDEQTPLAERRNLLFAGSSVIGGSARRVICATAAQTQLGRIASSLSGGEAQAAPPVLRLRRFTRLIAVLVLLAVVLLALIQWGRGASLEQVFFLTVALAVSAIPAGLPVAITVALSLGARRMAQRRVIVRHLPAVEGLGSCNFIASDKTGTLTINQLTAKRLVLADMSAWDVVEEPDRERVEDVLEPLGAAADDDVDKGSVGSAGDDDEARGAARQRLTALITTGALCNDATLTADDSGEQETGDGVNDAPALRAAHIGVAMGSGGTDVARETADFVLTDDNFSSVVAGIEEGRVAYDNVRKVIWLLLSTGAAEVLMFFLAIAAGLPLPLLPVQLLWLNLVTNGIQDVALAFERGESGVLRRPPRSPDQPIFDRLMVEQVLLSGVWIGTVAFAVFFYLVEVQGMAVEPARNLLLLLMVLFENVHTLSCRSERRSVFALPLRQNVLLVGAVLLAHGLHLGAMFMPLLGDVLEVQPVSVGQWGVLPALAASLLLPDELSKWWRRRRARDE